MASTEPPKPIGQDEVVTGAMLRGAIDALLYVTRSNMASTADEVLALAQIIAREQPKVTETCANCMHWSDKTAWTGSSAEIWGTARECRNPALGAASSHVASPNYDGPPTTLPDFGCNQFEAKP